MKKMFRTMVAVVLIASTAVAMSGCYGSFALTSKLHKWNGQVSNSKFVNELVFLGLCILPVYEVCTLADGLIFNSIEFWGGSNPIAMNEGAMEESDIMHDGHFYHVTKSKNNIALVQQENGNQINFRYFPEEKVWYKMEGENKAEVVNVRFAS